jgi:glycine betaine/proline transport system substrate-binding protein
VLAVGTAALLLSGCAGKAADAASSVAAGAKSAAASAVAGAKSAGASAVAGAASAAAAGGAAKDCGTVNIAQNPWVGYEANVAVVNYVLTNSLGCDVKVTDVDEQIAWQGFDTGQTDVILENWGHPDLEQKYITDKKVAEDVGGTGNQGVIGWYVPKWMADKYPDITDWNNLNKYADMFKTNESGGKGQLLDGDPSFVTNDEALVKNLGLNYKVVYAGSEEALIKALQQSTEKQTPLIMYFYEPQWALAKYPMVKVNLPEWKDGCDADPKTVACDYPPYPLNKIGRTEFMNGGSPAATMLKNFQWTNDDQNQVAEMITAQKMSDEEAAKAWVDANPDKVKAWLAGTGAA